MVAQSGKIWREQCLGVWALLPSPGYDSSIAQISLALCLFYRKAAFGGACQAQSLRASITPTGLGPCAGLSAQLDEWWEKAAAKAYAAPECSAGALIV
jgi:hypothetical protein